jgi:hypothetical protein
LTDNPQAVSSTSRRKGKCTLCGIEGHRANNKLFHPEGNPNAKVGLSRVAKKNAVHQPPRNVGELDDEMHNNSLDLHSDEEEVISDAEENQFSGEDMLNWHVDEEAHDPVQPGLNGQFGHQLPDFRGPPEGIHLGDIMDLNPDGSLIPIFSKFFTDDMFENMGQATNSFGQLYVKKWKEMKRSELAAFLGIVIYMGLIKYNGDRRKLWENTWKGNLFVRSVMTYARFEQILKAWHSTNYSDYTAEEIKQNKQLDPFWPIADLERALNTSFSSMMKPGQFLDIDEQCIPWKGRHKCRCYNKSKPVKRHFKVFSLNQSATGYQEAFYLYRGKAEDRPANISATAYPAEVLLANEKYQHKQHILFTDNWFTSFQQLTTCIKYGIHMVGTVQKKRKGVPFSWKPAHGVQQSRIRGEFQSEKSIFYASEDQIEDIYYTSWMDRKPVALLHTFPTKSGMCTRMVKTANDGWQRQEYTRPTIIPIYNKGMGGTDSGDQRMEAYRPELKTVSWIPRVLSHFINAAIVNSFIWYAAAFPEKNLSHYQFRDRLVDDMVKSQLEKKITETGKIREKSMSKKQWSKDKSRQVGSHYIFQQRKPADQRVEGLNPSNPSKQRNRNWFRGACMFCGRSVDTKCEQCRVWLCCVLNEDNQLTCFKEFHTSASFENRNSVAADDGSDEEEEADEEF